MPVPIDHARTSHPDHRHGLSGPHLVVGGLLLSGTVCTVGLLLAGHPLLAVLGSLTGLGLQTATIGLEQWLAARLHGTDPSPPPTWRMRLRAWWAESIWCARMFGWQQPFTEQRWPDRPEPTGRRGLVLVHGYCCNRAFWHPWRAALQAAGVPHVSVSLTPAFVSIDHYAPQLDQAVRQLHEATGLAPVLVCHSMGGLVARAWWRWRQQQSGNQAETPPAHHILTIGTPHGGTWLARHATPSNARQMRLASPWLQQLATTESTELHARMTCVYSACDNAVFPPSNACLAGAATLHFDGLGHIELAHDPRVRALALRLTEISPPR